MESISNLELLHVISIFAILGLALGWAIGWVYSLFGAILRARKKGGE